MADPLGEPVRIDDDNEQHDGVEEAGICPECGGRGNPCGSTQNVQFYNCEYCPETFSENL